MKIFRISEWMNAREAAEYLGITIQRISVLGKKKQIRRHDLLGNGKQYFYYRPDVEDRKKNMGEK